MHKKIYPLFLLLVLLLAVNTGFTQSPTDPAKGFNVFVEKSARFSSNETEGPIGIGGDLTIDGNYQVAIKSAGSFLVNKTLIGLLIQGKVNYKSGNSLQVNNGYVKIGSPDNSKVWYTDNNGAYSNIQITGGEYNSSPRIQLQKNAKDLGVSASNNPVFFGETLIDFGKSMETMRGSSSAISKIDNNVSLTDANGNPVSAGKYPKQVKITLNKGGNYLYITGKDLNSISNFTYNNKPDADHVLVVNVDANDVFNWSVWNQAGVGIDNCPYIMYNFFNTTTLKIEGNNTVEGTIFAPNADIFKKNNSANIEGQIIGISYEQDAGENHYANFNANVEGIKCAVPAVAAITGAATLCSATTVTLADATASGVWSSSNPLIATVSNAGIVTGVAAGTATISYAVTNSCGTTTVTKDIMVTTVPIVAAITGEATLCSSATISLADVTASGLWSSSNPLVATVSNAGLVTGVAAGSTTISYTVTNTCGTVAVTKDLTLTGLPKVEDIGGDDFVYIGLNTALKCATPKGVWTSSDEKIASVDNDGLVTGISKGDCKINYTVTEACGATTVSYKISSTESEDVSSGSSGGLESKSLGDAMAKRIYSAVTNSEFVKKPYSELPVLKQGGIVQKASGLNTQLNLLDLFPKQLSIATIKPYITTPTDIVNITNAKAVASSDYTLNGNCKAVVFATLTQSVLYDHTKAVCDRLKGATVQNIEKIKLMNIDLLRFNLKYEDGHTESVISFSAGSRAGRNSFSIQSNWLKSDYTVEDNMYNFQVWGVSNTIIAEITEKILNNLKAIAPIEQNLNINRIPKTYFVGVNRDATSINLNLKNTAQAVGGYFEILENVNEKNSLVRKKQIPFAIGAAGATQIQLPISDVYESTIKMYVKDSLVDEIFISDGAWALDYNASNTIVKNFEISNDPNRVIKDEFPVFRNIQLEAATNTYITAYKLMRGGGMAQDLSGYKTFKFNASGNSTFKITLVKSSIKNWDDQYTLKIPVSGDAKDYLIDLNEFVSTATTDKIKPIDINSIVITMSTSSGKVETIKSTLSNISFSKQTISYIESLKSKEVNIFPNPSSGKFNCSFKSDKSSTANLMVTDAYTGRSILVKPISIEKGENTVAVDISSYYQKANGSCIITIQNEEATYRSKKIIIVPNQ